MLRTKREILETTCRIDSIDVVKNGGMWQSQIIVTLPNGKKTNACKGGWSSDHATERACLSILRTLSGGESIPFEPPYSRSPRKILFVSPVSKASPYRNLWARSMS